MKNKSHGNCNQVVDSLFFCFFFFFVIGCHVAKIAAVVVNLMFNSYQNIFIWICLGIIWVRILMFAVTLSDADTREQNRTKNPCRNYASGSPSMQSNDVPWIHRYRGFDILFSRLFSFFYSENVSFANSYRSFWIQRRNSTLSLTEIGKDLEKKPMKNIRMKNICGVFIKVN